MLGAFAYAGPRALRCWPYCLALHVFHTAAVAGIDFFNEMLVMWLGGVTYFASSNRIWPHSRTGTCRRR